MIKLSKLTNKLENKYKNSIIYLLFTATLLIYLHNLSPSVYGGDSGDLILAALSRGIPHPSGYPLFTMIGNIFTNLPIPFTTAWKVGLVSVLFSSLSVVIVYLIIIKLTKNRLISIITSLTLAFTYPFWLYAEIVEVFALHSFFILLLVYLTISYLINQQKKYLYLLCLSAGLSMTNNLSIALLFPGIILTIFLANKKLFIDIKTLFKCLLFFILGLTPYLYIPLAAKGNPFYSWGKAVTLENALALILRKEYGWTPKEVFNIEIPLTRLKSYFNYWRLYINPLYPALTLLGFLSLLIKKKWKLLVLLSASYLFLGPIALLYPRNPISTYLVLVTFEKFYIGSFIILALFIPFGIIYIQEIISKLLGKHSVVKPLQKLTIYIMFLLPISLFITNFRSTNLSKIYIGDNYASDIITNLPKNSNLILLGDNEIFNTLYVQKVNNLRDDIYIPGRHDSLKGLLYANGLTEEEIERYQINNLGRILKSDLYRALPNLVKEKPTFSDTKFEDIPIIDEKFGKLLFIPYGLVYQLEFENNFNLSKQQYLSKVNQITNSYHLNNLHNNVAFTNNNLVAAEIKLRYALAYYKIGRFIATNYEDAEVSKVFFEKAIELDPLGLIIK